VSQGRPKPVWDMQTIAFITFIVISRAVFRDLAKKLFGATEKCN
jgi:hypothetical protein